VLAVKPDDENEMHLNGDSPEELAAAALEVVAKHARRDNATAAQLDALRELAYFAGCTEADVDRVVLG